MRPVEAIFLTTSFISPSLSHAGGDHHHQRHGNPQSQVQVQPGAKRSLGSNGDETTEPEKKKTGVIGFGMKPRPGGGAMKIGMNIRPRPGAMMMKTTKPVAPAGPIKMTLGSSQVRGHFMMFWQVPPTSP